LPDLDRPGYSRPTGIRAGCRGRASGTRRIPAVRGGGSGSGCGDRGGVGNEGGDEGQPGSGLLCLVEYFAEDDIGEIGLPRCLFLDKSFLRSQDFYKTQE
jgi:hypothetical protein